MRAHCAEGLKRSWVDHRRGHVAADLVCVVQVKTVGAVLCMRMYVMAADGPGS